MIDYRKFEISWYNRGRKPLRKKTDIGWPQMLIPVTWWRLYYGNRPIIGLWWGRLYPYMKILFGDQDCNHKNFITDMKLDSIQGAHIPSYERHKYER